MRLNQLGERKIIKILEEYFEPCTSTEVGIGDDAAAVRVNKKLLIVSTDMIRQKTHVPEEMQPWQVGWYSVNAALSDIASMGASPVGLLLSLGLPEEMSLDYLQSLASGIRDACSYHETCVIGGDTKAHSELTIAVTALGQAEKVMTRGSAEEGELICVTGRIGEAAAGFYCLVKNLEIPEREELLKAALEPTARVKEGIVIARYSKCCMDISDGLAFSLHEIAKQSGVGFEVFEEKIPRSRAVKKVSSLAEVPEREIVFHKGGDFELLFTIREEKLQQLREDLKGMVEITPIGRVTGEGRKLITEKGEEVELSGRGYESFIRQIEP